MQARMVLISLTRWISLSEQLCLTHMKFHYLNCGHAAPLLSSLPFHFSFRVLLWEWFLYIYLIKPIISVISPMALTNILFIPSILFISSSHVSLLKGRPTVRYVLILLLSLIHSISFQSSCWLDHQRGLARKLASTYLDSLLHIFLHKGKWI